MKNSIKRFLSKFEFKIIRNKDYALYNSSIMQKKIVEKSTKCPVIFDIGAHHGSVSLAYNSLFHKAKIYSFEPFPDSFKDLKRNTKNLENIQSYELAVSDINGESSFYSYKSSPTNSLLATDPMAEEIWKKGLFDLREIFTVSVKTIDELVKEFSLKKIDLLKLDVQGAEPKVLKGAEQAIKGGLIKVIYTEIITLPTYQGQLGLIKSLELFYEYGYSLVGLYNYSYTKKGFLRQVDAIFEFKE